MIFQRNSCSHHDTAIWECVTFGDVLRLTACAFFSPDLYAIVNITLPQSNTVQQICCFLGTCTTKMKFQMSSDFYFLVLNLFSQTCVTCSWKCWKCSFCIHASWWCCYNEWYSSTKCLLRIPPSSDNIDPGLIVFEISYYCLRHFLFTANCNFFSTDNYFSILTSTSSSTNSFG